MKQLTESETQFFKRPLNKTGLVKSCSEKTTATKSFQTERVKRESSWGMGLNASCNPTFWHRCSIETSRQAGAIYWDCLKEKKKRTKPKQVTNSKTKRAEGIECNTYILIKIIHIKEHGVGRSCLKSQCSTAWGRNAHKFKASMNYKCETGSNK